MTMPTDPLDHSAVLGFVQQEYLELTKTELDIKDRIMILKNLSNNALSAQRVSQEGDSVRAEMEIAAALQNTLQGLKANPFMVINTEGYTPPVPEIGEVTIYPDELSTRMADLTFADINIPEN